MQEIPEEKFDDDPIKHLKIENEIIKLKLKAQYGDAFQMFIMDESLSPEVENQFLKNMMQFEENYKNASFITIHEKLGNTVYPFVESLSEEQLQAEIDKFLLILNEKEIYIDFLYQPINKIEVYKFLTGEFLELKIEKAVPEGVVCNFIYEEFRPNHKEDITALTHKVIVGWVTKHPENLIENLAKDILDEKGQVYSEEEIITRITNFISSFEYFTNDAYSIANINYQLHENGESGFGHGEGAVKFDAVLENGEKIHYEGAYIIYYSYQFGYWYIFNFVLPGFSWG